MLRVNEVGNNTSDVNSGEIAGHALPLDFYQNSLFAISVRLMFLYGQSLIS